MTIKQVTLEPLATPSRSIYCYAAVYTDFAKLSFVVKSRDGRVQPVSSRFGSEWRPAFWLNEDDLGIVANAVWDELNKVKLQVTNGAA